MGIKKEIALRMKLRLGFCLVIASLASSCTNSLLDVVKKDVASAKATVPIVDSFTIANATSYDGAVSFTIVSSHFGTSASSITHWLVNESSTAPSAADSLWTATSAPVNGTYTVTGTYTLSSPGTYGDRTLYAWMKSDLGLVSASATAATSTVHYVQYGAPVVNLALTSATPTDNPAITFDLSKSTAGSGGSSITGWLVNESATAPAAADIPTTATAPTGFTLGLTAGEHRVYVWAKSNAGKVGFASIPVTINHRTAHLPIYSFIAGHEALTASFDVAMTSATITGGGTPAMNPKTPAPGDWSADKKSVTVASSSLWPASGGSLAVSGTTSYGIPIDAASQSYSVVYCTCVSGTSGSDSSGLGTPRAPYATIQVGVDNAKTLYTTATVRVAASTTAYTSNYGTTGKPVVRLKEGISVYGSYSEDFLTRPAITLTNPPTSIMEDTSTTTSSATLYRTVETETVTPVVTIATVLDGFIIKSASISIAKQVTAIYCEASPTISNCMIYGRATASKSFGIYISNSAPIIKSCIVNSGTGSSSTAIYAGASSPVAPQIFNNDIAAGLSMSDAGSQRGIDLSTGPVNAIIYSNKISGGVNTNSDVSTTEYISYGIYNLSSPKIYNNVILGGTSFHTYGVYTATGNLELRNNTIDAGVAKGSGGMDNAAVFIQSGKPYIDNNILFTTTSALVICYGIYENSAVVPYSVNNNDFFSFTTSPHVYYRNEGTTDITSISTINGWAEAEGNIDVNPTFTMSPDIYHLQSSSAVKALGLNGAAQSPAWGFITDFSGTVRTPLDATSTGWSIGAFEQDL
jgi:hypothetical protein